MLPALSIVIPAFNEEARLLSTLEATCDFLERESPASEILVVDDGSTDSTSAIARDILLRHEVAAHVITQPSNRGKGAAVRCGLLTATRPIGIFYDADLSTPLSEVAKVIMPIVRDEADVVIGSRALDRSLIGDHQPWRREYAGRVFNFLVRRMTGLPFADTQCGFKAFHLTRCRWSLEAARVDGFGFDVELLALASRAHLRCQEVAVRWNHREASKVHFLHDSVAMFRDVIALRNVSRGRGSSVPARRSSLVSMGLREHDSGVDARAGAR